MSSSLAKRALGLITRRLPGASHDLSPGHYVQTARQVAVLKTLFYSARFRAPVIVGRGCRLRVHRSAKLQVDRGALLIGLAHATPAGASVELRPRSRLRVSGVVQLMRASRVLVDWDASLSLGARSYVNDGGTLICGTEMTIGDGCAIAMGALVMDTDTHQLHIEGRPRARHAPVTLAPRTWIGANATVLKGVSIGADGVVAAGSVVTGDVEPGQVVAGVPARPVAHGATWTP
jgi:acetyltransferase-like isoleucine patch superfamily enzyme